MRSRDELIREIDLLKRRNEMLERELKEQETLKFNWAGNLGRWELNLKTYEVKFNPLKIMALGYKEGEIEPDMHGFCNMIHPEDYEKTMEKMRLHLSGKTSVYEAEYRIQTKDGHYRTYYDRGRISLYDDDGHPLIVTGIVFDITQQREMEARMKEMIFQLKQENDITNRVLSIISHDLRGTIGAISSLTDLFLMDNYSLSDVDKQTFMENINISAKSSLSILENLLKWAKNMKGEIAVHRITFDVNDIIEEIIQLNKSVLFSKTITVHFEKTSDALIEADRSMVHTILRNIFSNALKFTPKNGNINVSMKSCADRMDITIKDSGMGMDADKLKSIKKGLVESTDGTEGEKGSGMGLGLIKRFVTLNDGIFFISSEPDQGTSVTVGFKRSK